MLPIEWEVLDFSYRLQNEDEVAITGFSELGLTKIRKASTLHGGDNGIILQFPLTDERGRNVVEIYRRAFFVEDCYEHGQIVGVTDWGNIRIIGDEAFASPMPHIGITPSRLEFLPSDWKNVEEIGERAFAFCHMLTSIAPSWGGVSSIQPEAFFGCNLHQLPNTWGKVTSIGAYSFAFNKINKVPGDWGNISVVDPGALMNNCIESLPEYYPYRCGDGWYEPGGYVGSRAFASNSISKKPKRKNENEGNTIVEGDAFAANPVSCFN